MAGICAYVSETPCGTDKDNIQPANHHLVVLTHPTDSGCTVEALSSVTYPIDTEIGYYQHIIRQRQTHEVTFRRICLFHSHDRNPGNHANTAKSASLLFGELERVGEILCLLPPELGVTFGLIIDTSSGELHQTIDSTQQKRRIEEQQVLELCRSDIWHRLGGIWRLIGRPSIKLQSRNRAMCLENFAQGTLSCLTKSSHSAATKFYEDIYGVRKTGRGRASTGPDVATGNGGYTLNSAYSGRRTIHRTHASVPGYNTYDQHTPRSLQ